MQLAMAVLHFY